MFRKSLCFLVSILLLIPGLARAQDGTDEESAAAFQVIILDANNSEFLRVDLEGELERIPVPVDDGAFVGPADVRFSPDGRLLALTAPVFDEEGQQSQRLEVIDFGSGDVVLVRDFPASSDILVSAFRDDGAALAVGVVNYLYGDQEGADPDIPSWELMLIEIESNTVLQTLSALDAGVLRLERELEDIAYMPLVQVYDAEGVAFTQVPWIGPAFDDTYGVLWDYEAGRVENAPAYASPILAQSPSGDEIMIGTYDPARESATLNLPILPLNVVQRQDEAPQAIFTTAEGVIMALQYIENGERLAVQLLSSGDDASAPIPAMSWLALDRDGDITLLEDASGLGFSELRNAPGGYVALGIAYSEDFSTPPVVTLHYQQGEDRRVLFEGAGDFFNIVWTSPVEATPDLNPFPAIE